MPPQGTEGDMTEAQQYCAGRAAEIVAQSNKIREQAADVYRMCEYSGFTLRNSDCRGNDCECYVHGPRISRIIEQADTLLEDAAEWQRWARDPQAAERALPRQQLALGGVQ